jgi:hypothetical protein
MPEPSWIAAAPFRAHLNHVCSATGLPWPVVALHAGLPLGLVRHLLDTRPGRQVHRIAPEFARQVFGVSEQSLRDLRTSTAPAGAAHRAARRLVGLGLPAPALARQLRVSHGDLRALLAGAVTEVPTLLELRLRALVVLTEPGRPARAGSPRRAA